MNAPLPKIWQWKTRNKRSNGLYNQNPFPLVGEGFFLGGIGVTTELLLLNCAIALAGIVQASAGLGFAMVANPLLALINMAYLPGPMLFANLFLSSAILWREGLAIDRREMPPLLLGLLLGTTIGALILTQIAADRLGVVFGVIIIAAVLLSIFSPVFPLTRRNVLFGATGGGITGIVAAMHAPPLVMLYQREEPAKIRATFAVLFVVGCIMAMAALWLAGRFGMAEVWMGISLLPGIVVGFLAGRVIAARVTRDAARTAMLTISGIGGIVLLFKSL